jgi:trimeric autotransporter adhesin
VRDWGLRSHSSSSDATYSSNATSIEWQFDNRTNAATSTAENTKASIATSVAANKQSASTKQTAVVVTATTAGNAHNSSQATTCAQSNESDEQLTSSTSDTHSHNGEHTAAAIIEANAADTVTADGSHTEHNSSVAAAAAEPEATPEHSVTELSIQQQCTSILNASVPVTSDSSDKAATDSTVVSTNSNSLIAAAETSKIPAAVFCSGFNCNNHWTQSTCINV